jgi:hypothetical protein
VLDWISSICLSGLPRQKKIKKIKEEKKLKEDKRRKGYQPDPILNIGRGHAQKGSLGPRLAL